MSIADGHAQKVSHQAVSPVPQRKYESSTSWIGGISPILVVDADDDCSSLLLASGLFWLEVFGVELSAPCLYAARSCACLGHNRMLSSTNAEIAPSATLCRFR
jgi:hypothetical protein